MSKCIFCLIVHGDAPARLVYEDASTVAFLNIAPATRGHTLLIPKAHVTDIWEMQDWVASAVAVATLRVAHLLRDRLKPSGLNVVQANGGAAWQTVPHFHVHLVPRYDARELNLPWQPRPVPDEDLAEVHATLRAKS